MKKLNPLLCILICISINCFGQVDTAYFLKDYLENHRLYDVTDVESKRDTLIVFGYEKSEDDMLKKRKVALKKNQVLAITNNFLFWKFTQFQQLPISITTVPFKIRPKLDEFETNVASGLSNFGLNIDFWTLKMARYFASGGKSYHNVHAGIFLAPSIEELGFDETRGFLMSGKKSKQLFYSMALTLNYSYNNLTFTICPIGFDFATSPIGKEWIYNGKRWWGFGIGLQPNFLKSSGNK